MRMNLTAVGAIALVALTGVVGCANPQGSIASLNNDAIIGGTDATGKEDFAKTIVSLYDVEEGSLCTASIISSELLLTAAHCVMTQPENLRVIFGVNLESNDIQVRAVDTYVVSDLWKTNMAQELNTGDIAVVKFVGGLAPGYKATKVLANADVLKNQQTTLLAGYGLSNGAEQTGAGRLRYVETKIQDLKYSKTEVLVDQSQGKGACHGDSGGPAYVKVNNEWVVWGVTSRGVNDPKNDCSVSAAYTSVPAYAQWLVKVVDALSGVDTEASADSTQPVAEAPEAATPAAPASGAPAA